MKRWIVRIVLCLILGCVTTVAVAWAISLYFAEMPFASGDTRVIRNAGWDHPADSRVTVGAAEARLIAGSVFPTNESVNREELLRWGEQLLADLGPASQRSGPTLMARGYPMLALGCIVEETRTATGAWRTRAHYVLVCEPNDQFSYTVIPIRPLLPGFLIDTLFYSVIWFGIFFGFGSARRAIRKKRGRCPKCAYQLRGQLDAGCSECGWNRPEDDT